MRRWRVSAEKKPRDQTQTYKTSDVSRLICAAVIKSTKRKRVRIAAKETITGIDGRTIVEIGNDHDIRLVISYTGFDPAFKLTRVVGRAQVCVPHATPNLETTELVYQKNVDHTGHRIAAIN